MRSLKTVALALILLLVTCSALAQGYGTGPGRSYSRGPQKLLVLRYADINGDGTGSDNANGDYSGAEEIFYIEPPAGEIWRVARMIVHIEDATAMWAARYGGEAALGTGVVVRVQDDSGTIIDLTDAIPVKTNAQWAAMCFDVDVKAWGTGTELLAVRWTFTKAGQFIRLDGDSNERLEIVLNDDLRGLISHRFFIQGYIE